MSAAEIHAATEAAAFRKRQAEREAQRLAARCDPAIQFSLRDLFAVVTLMSIELAGLHWLSAKHFAGLAGLAALVWLICLTQLRFPSPLGQMIWWTLFAVYLLSMVFTLVPRGG